MNQTQAPQPNPEPTPKPTASPAPAHLEFFDALDREIAAQKQKQATLDGRIASLNVEREEVLLGIKRLKQSRSLVGGVKKKLFELRDTLKSTVAAQETYLDHLETSHALESLLPLVESVQAHYQTQADLGRQILTGIEESEAQVHICQEITRMLSEWRVPENTVTPTPQPANKPATDLIKDTPAEAAAAISAPTYTPYISTEGNGEMPSNFSTDDFFVQTPESEIRTISFDNTTLVEESDKP